MLGGTLTLWYDGPSAVAELLSIYQKSFLGIEDFHSNNMLLYLLEAGSIAARVVFPLFLTVFVAAVLAEVAQVGLKFSFKLTAFDFSKLSVFQGLKRLLGFREGSAVESFPLGLCAEISKIVVCLVVLAGCACACLASIAKLVLWTDYSSVDEAARLGMYVVARLIGVLLGAAVLIGLCELTLERRRRYSRLCMSVEELKQELRESEGDPEIRAQRRHLYREIFEQRMLHSIRRAKLLIVGGLPHSNSA